MLTISGSVLGDDFFCVLSNKVCTRRNVACLIRCREGNSQKAVLDERKGVPKSQDVSRCVRGFNSEYHHLFLARTGGLLHCLEAQ